MKGIIILLFVLLPSVTTAQQHVHKEHKGFYPFISVNYNYIKIQSVSLSEEAVFENSNFFGSEFGFSIFPKNESGLYFDYNNKFIGELGVREIYKLFNSPDSEQITDNTISSGFFGSLDIGKQVNSNKNSQFIAGIRLSDKYISGIDLINNHSGVNDIEYEGFHLSPGIYGEYKRKLNKSFSFCAKAVLTQSVLNFWKFAENGDEFEFRHPLFTDLNVNLRHKSGIFIKAETNFMIPYSDIDPSFRISFGAGFRF